MPRFEYASLPVETRAYVISRVSEVTRKAVNRDLARLADVRARSVNGQADSDARRAARLEVATIETRVREGVAELRQLGASAEETRGIETRLEARLAPAPTARYRSAEVAGWAAAIGGGGW